ncbi:glycosyl transferase [Aphanothece hegewaldii CCALA 016]|uniref:Glycosyl transferase n=1 Tax=Aphanothece hegewaldii CCALA 016 TaxID=2107694 RepID=A0A2T1LWG3_9CHRO|nr:glycosyltransferase [Aphanothece hegewaldii]PSF36243.1 glycosyl transferase [Aphanothece hegewaldii CCALA 016]
MNNDFFISVIIPVYNSEKSIEKCLTSVINSDYQLFEIIVIDNRSTDNSSNIIEKTVKNVPHSFIKLEKNVGQSVARNIGALQSHGELLFFLDSDIIIESDTLKQISDTFHRKADISGLFCSYQIETIPSNFYSIYKNVLHHYTHQYACEDAATFCGGYGAIKKDIFFKIGQFNQNYRCLEDIELGYRLYQAGHKIYLNKNIQLTHCKEYSFIGLIKSDVLNRAIPWTQLMLKNQIFKNDLNTKINNVFSVPISFLILFILPFVLFYSFIFYIFILLILLLITLNYHFYYFVLQKKGFMFTLKTMVMNWFNYIYSGVGLVLGILLYLYNTYFNISSNQRN